MDDIGRWLLFLVFFVLGFLFSGAETALLSMNETKLRSMAETDLNRQQTVSRLLEQPIRRKIIWINLTCLLCLTVSIYHGVFLVADELRQFISGIFEQSSWWLMAGVEFLSFIVSSFFVLTISHMLPKRIFSRNSEKYLFGYFSVIHGISYLFRPLVMLIFYTSSGLASILGFPGKHLQEEITEEEIRSMVDEGEEKGVIEQEEREMINNIFDFDDRTASDLMTHRTDVVAVEIDSKISDVVFYAINEGFSRIPVYEKDIDNIKGIIYVKDLLCLVGCKSAEDFNLKDFLRKVIYVPEAKKCVDLFRMFKSQKIHLAVVVDDYGGTAGIISMEDLLEAIVGNIQDEYDDEQEEIIALSETSYLLDGALSLEKLEKLFHKKFECDEDTGTLGGLITDTLGRIPDDGENPEVEIDGVIFTVVLVEDRRVIKVKVELPADPKKEEHLEEI